MEHLQLLECNAHYLLADITFISAARITNENTYMLKRHDDIHLSVFSLSAGQSYSPRPQNRRPDHRQLQSIKKVTERLFLLMLLLIIVI